MAKPSLQRNLPPMEVEPLERPLSTPLKSLELWRALVVRALARSQTSQKAAASDMGIGEAQFSRQLAGTENLSFWKMHGLPPAFWGELILLICEYQQITLHGTQQDVEDLAVGRLFREAVTRVRRQA